MRRDQDNNKVTYLFKLGGLCGDTGLIGCCESGPGLICPPVIVLSVWHLHVVTEADEDFGLSQLLHRRPLAQLEQAHKEGGDTGQAAFQNLTSETFIESFLLLLELFRGRAVPLIYTTVSSQHSGIFIWISVAHLHGRTLPITQHTGLAQQSCDHLRTEVNNITIDWPLHDHNTLTNNKYCTQRSNDYILYVIMHKAAK